MLLLEPRVPRAGFALAPSGDAGVFFAGSRASTVALAPGFLASKPYLAHVASLFAATQHVEAVPDQLLGLVLTEIRTAAVDSITAALAAIATSLESLVDSTPALLDAFIAVKCLQAVVFSTPSSSIPLVFDWINLADGQPDIATASEVMLAPVPFNAPGFWPYLTRLCMRGLFAEACRVLAESGHPQTPVFADVAELFAAFWEYHGAGQLVEWKQQACMLRDAVGASDEAPTTIRALHRLLCVVTGMRVTIAAEAASWYEAYAAVVAFGSGSASDMLESVPPAAASAWETLCVDIVELRMVGFLRGLEALDPCTAAHVSRVLDLWGVEGVHGPSQFLLHAHAMWCLGNASSQVVLVGAGILVAQGSATARPAIAEFLKHFRFDTNDDIEWALALCLQLALPVEARALYRAAGHRSMAAGRWLEAVELFAKGDDVDSVRQYGWDMFEAGLVAGAAVHGEEVEKVLVGEASVSPAVRQCLAPYAVLVQFYHQRASGSARTALTLLMTLLSFPHLPSRYFPVLVGNVLPYIALDSAAPLLAVLELVRLVEAVDSVGTNMDNDGLVLYAEAAAVAADLPEYDWRERLRQFGVAVPADVGTMLAWLRGRVAKEVGRVYVGAAA